MAFHRISLDFLGFRRISWDITWLFELHYGYDMAALLVIYWGYNKKNDVLSCLKLWYTHTVAVLIGQRVIHWYRVDALYQR